MIDGIEEKIITLSKQTSLSQKRSRAKKKLVIDDLKNVPCTDCGNTFPPCCMDFDHIEGIKEFSIGNNLTRSLDSLLTEIEKCEIVCANCHRLRTFLRGRKHESGPLY